MKKLFLLPVTLVFSFFNLAYAQGAGNAVVEASGNILYNNPGGYVQKPVNLNPDQVYSYSYGTQLEASVMINVKASGYVAIFSLTQTGKTIEEVEAAMTNRTEFFKKLMLHSNTGAMQVFIDPITMVPTYEMEVTQKKYSKTFNEVPTGFEMKKNVHVTFKNQSDINDIITAAAKAEVYDLVKVEYSVDDLEGALATIRNEALKILLSKKAMLEQAGIFTRFVNLAEKNGSAYPAERYEQYIAQKTSIPAIYSNYDDKKPVKTTYNYVDKNKTIYYDKVSDKQFDKVINPVVNEPMVQIYLSIKGQYQVYDEQKDAEEKAYNKRLKEIQLKLLELDVDAKKKDIDLKGRSPIMVEPVKKIK
ncbi:MAG TPA: SIMPL domain-containing protein, partial [Ferruginibacter sp.]|mgnify:CR=1 FL=1|nr:SIMPL domain-containing protein [Bacteroidota bacterium]HMT97677.1 SIMPL domain-containing protein [Ferruginibacter sp.]HMU25763.1 SIMPL domain-containing protein [Ferruginibacter sp.]